MTSQELVQKQRDLVAFADDERLRGELAEILPPEISVPVFIRGLKNAALKNPDILKADQASLYRAVLHAGMDGLIPDGREAAIVVFSNQASYLPMIGGLKKVAADFGWMLNCRAVYENDEFSYSEEPPELLHIPVRPGAERGQIIAAYAVATHKDGRRLQRVLHPADVQKRRAKAKTQNVWKEWEAQMWEKSAGHEIFDDLPLDTKDRERIDRILAADTNGEQAIDALYGGKPANPHTSAVQGDEAGLRSPASPPPPNVNTETGEIHEPEDAGPPFEGEEPFEETPVEEAEIEIVDEPTFGGKKHAGKTVQQVWDEGDHNYVRWARRNWLTGDIVGALETFAQEHPEIDE